MERLPAIFSSHIDHKTFNSEREILYQVLFDMKKDMNDLKKLVHEIMSGQHQGATSYTENSEVFFAKRDAERQEKAFLHPSTYDAVDDDLGYQEAEEFDEVETTPIPTSLEDMEKQMIRKTLEKHRGRRKAAAEELKISERTLYRKIKEYGIE